MPLHPSGQRPGLLCFLGPAAAVLAISGCGGGAPAPAAPPADTPAALSLIPVETRMKVGGQARFSAADASGAAVPSTFSIPGGGATIDPTGRFQAPAQPGTFQVKAQAVADARRTGTATAKVEAYAGRLAVLPNSQVARTGHSATLLEDGDVLVVGGRVSASAERFSPGTGAFTLAASLGATRIDHTATGLPAGRVLVTGGEGTAGTFDTALVYEAGAFTPAAGVMASPRRRHTETLLADGRVLLAGGLPLSGFELAATGQAELFDPTTRTFQATGAMVSQRTDHTATRLPDGRVLVVGGRDSTCFFTCPLRIWPSAELFDPRTGTFTPTGAMALARFNHTATLLPDGRVLIAGGTTPDLPDTDVADSVEIFDPATGRFTAAGRMLRPRTEHRATLLGSGAVLFSGGHTVNESTYASSTVEAFNPLTGASSLADSDRTTRSRHAAVRLESGEVVLIGGTEGGGPIAIAERYE